MRYLSRSAARRDIVDYIEMFYNSRRRHSSLGYMNPMEFEQQQYSKKAAYLNVYFYLTTSLEGSGSLVAQVQGISGQVGKGGPQAVFVLGQGEHRQRADGDAAKKDQYILGGFVHSRFSC